MDVSRNMARQQELLKVAEQASAWLVAVEEDDRKEFPALVEWLKESPLHIEFFLRAAAVDRLIDSAAAEDRQRILQLVDAADENAAITHLYPVRDRIARARAMKRGLWSFGLAAAVLLGIGVAGWVLAHRSGATQTIATAVGEQRSVSLPDSSVLYLNADTRVEIAYTKGQRNIRLVRGEALFKVQRDANRPFRVQVDDAVVEAVGTQFNIYRRPQQTAVTVVEGAVRIERTAPSTSAASVQAHLEAGEAVLLTPQARTTLPARVDVAQVTAWRERRLVFRWAPLGTIVEEFNRYNSSPKIRIASAALSERRYTVVFDADAPRDLMRFLERDRDINISTDGDTLIIQEK